MNIVKGLDYETLTMKHNNDKEEDKYDDRNEEDGSKPPKSLEEICQHLRKLKYGNIFIQSDKTPVCQVEYDFSVTVVFYLFMFLDHHLAIVEAIREGRRSGLRKALNKLNGLNASFINYVDETQLKVFNSCLDYDLDATSLFNFFHSFFC